MAHRCRVCGEAHFSSARAIAFPFPEKLARINPVILDLLEAARDFESCADGQEVGTPVEFVEWLARETQRAALLSAR